MVGIVVRQDRDVLKMGRFGCEANTKVNESSDALVVKPFTKSESPRLAISNAEDPSALC